jgi:hypothetical protein
LERTPALLDDDGDSIVLFETRGFARVELMDSHGLGAFAGYVIDN